MSTHNLCFVQKYEKYLSFFFENFQFLEMKFSIYLNRCVFVIKVKQTRLALRRGMGRSLAITTLLTYVADNKLIFFSFCPENRL